jgi:hypothetical protein
LRIFVSALQICRLPADWVKKAGAFANGLGISRQTFVDGGLDLLEYTV